MNFVKKLLHEKKEDKSMSIKSPKTKINPLLSKRKTMQDQEELLHAKYQIYKEIGRGSDGIVKTCKLRSNWYNKMNNNNINNGKNNKGKLETRAIKIIDKSQVKSNHLNDIYNEMNILRQISDVPHTNIVNWYESFETPNNIYIVTEMLSNDTLQDRIVNAFNKNVYGFKEINIAIMFYQILEGLAYLHNMNIVHRDLKPENILFGKNSCNTIKIIDFGLAGVLTKENGYKLDHPCGTPFFVAPEVIDPKNKSREYDYKCDMWSSGVILYAMICGYLPFKLNENEPLKILYKQILKGHIPMISSMWYHIKDDLKDLVMKLLNTDPNQRLSAHEALEHEWFTRVFHDYCFNQNQKNSKNKV